MTRTELIHFNNLLAQKLKAARIASGKTIEQLDDLLPESEEYYAFYEMWPSTMTMEYFYEVCFALDIKPNHLSKEDPTISYSEISPKYDAKIALMGHDQDLSDEQYRELIEALKPLARLYPVHVINFNISFNTKKDV